jgi:hypothetical protein
LTEAALLAQRALPKHLEEAQELVKHLGLTETEYRHKDTVVRWKGLDGAIRYEARTDCSGFIDALLEHSYGLTRADFKKWTGRARPLANTYYAVIDQGKGFTKVDKVQDIQPGDILAIRYPAGADDTGHVLLVSRAPLRRAASAPLEAGADQWELQVIDCTRSGHGKTDTRYKPDGTFTGGVGAGTFRLYTDKAGKFAGHTWSTAAKSEYRSQRDRPIVAGRFDPKFRP